MREASAGGAAAGRSLVVAQRSKGRAGAAAGRAAGADASGTGSERSSRMRGSKGPMRVDVWSDIACPWCWLGKRHLEEAVRRLGLEGKVEVEMRSFELAPRQGASEPAKGILARKFGSAEAVEQAHRRLAAMGERAGIRYDFERALVANTFDAHRVHHLAKARGRGAQVVERLMRAYHGEGADLADHATLRRLAAEEGLDAGEVDRVLASDAYADEVRADEAEAAALGIHGVPFFVLDGRYGVSGAQPVEAFERALRTALAPRAADPAE